MAEDAVESAGAKAPAITISTQQIIAGEGVLMPDERCPAVHPELGLQCDRKVWDCWGIDHICTIENGLGEFWRNELGSSPMHRYFEDWMIAKQNVTEEAEKDAMPTMNENTDSQPQQPYAGPRCPACSTPLELQLREPLVYWCAMCRKWFDGELKRL
jgi:hypothetical protein